MLATLLRQPGYDKCHDSCLVTTSSSRPAFTERAIERLFAMVLWALRLQNTFLVLSFVKAALLGSLQS